MLEYNCPYGDDSLVVADYLAGRLSASKTQAFEAHSFGCQRCFGELQSAGELRAALDEPLAVGKRVWGPPVRSRNWLPLATAATIVLAVGLWMAMPLMDDAELAVEAVYRDAGDAATDTTELRLVVVRNGDTVSLDWNGVQGTDQYRVRVFSAAGDPVFEQETTQTSIELTAGQWQRDDAVGKSYVQVLALDELRQIILQSDFEPL